VAAARQDGRSSSLKKRSKKNFCSLDDQAVSGMGCVSPGAKVFLVLFSKKNTLRLYP
jgi:hypothetical protein